MKINLPVSVGDFLDRLTILQIKEERIADPQKHKIVQEQLTEYTAISDHLLPEFDNKASSELAQLRATNEALWTVEDDLRCCEAAGRFGQEFVELARSVYRLNDQRATLKRALDAKFGSPVGDVKDFSVP